MDLWQAKKRTVRSIWLQKIAHVTWGPILWSPKLRKIQHKMVAKIPTPKNRVNNVLSYFHFDRNNDLLFALDKCYGKLSPIQHITSLLHPLRRYRVKLSTQNFPPHLRSAPLSRQKTSLKYVYFFYSTFEYVDFSIVSLCFRIFWKQVFLKEWPIFSLYKRLLYFVTLLVHCRILWYLFFSSMNVWYKKLFFWFIKQVKG